MLSNNDGCVIARSAESKKLGFKTGNPFFEIKDIVRKHRIHMFSSNYALYADMSNRVMTTLEEMAPSVEIYSIDEAFMNLSGVSNCMSLEQFGRDVRERVLQRTKLAVGAGIAPTKTLTMLGQYNGAKPAAWWISPPTAPT